MSSSAIQVRGLSKRFRIGAGPSYRLFGDVVRGAVRRPLRWVRNVRRPAERPHEKDDEIWALKDVSFDVSPGEVLGVIGHNGAGKSTLLKILARITEPTEGYADIRGRLGSLLEVGTGFHQELSGRENIYLSGALLGMRRAEIDRKLDQIVAFSEIEKFLDTPVKRYSSGMYTRLAFAVAAHLEPEVLLVDEVLAVGDAAFQKKCLGKMDQVAQSGRTILFVSHNLAAIQALCPKSLWLGQGKRVEFGDTATVVPRYLESLLNERPVPLDQRTDRQGDGAARIRSMHLESADGGAAICTGSRLRITLEYEGREPLRFPRVYASIYDMSNAGICVLDSDALAPLPQGLPARGTLTCVTDPIRITPGRCYATVGLFRGSALADRVERAAYFDVEPDNYLPSGKYASRDRGVSVIRYEWSADGSQEGNHGS